MTAEGVELPEANETDVQNEESTRKPASTK